MLQLSLWVDGYSFHDNDDRCCPDMSCCLAGTLVPREERELFQEAVRQGHTRLEHRLATMFILRVMDQVGVDVVEQVRAHKLARKRNDLSRS